METVPGEPAQGSPEGRAAQAAGSPPAGQPDRDSKHPGQTRATDKAGGYAAQARSIRATRLTLYAARCRPGTGHDGLSAAQARSARTGTAGSGRNDSLPARESPAAYGNTPNAGRNDGLPAREPPAAHGNAAGSGRDDGLQARESPAAYGNAPGTGRYGGFPSRPGKRHS